jgi:hypothetical protein
MEIQLLQFSLFLYLTILGESTFEAPGVGLEPTSLGRHQLSYFMISRLTPFRAFDSLPSLGTPAFDAFINSLEYLFKPMVLSFDFY